MATRRYGISVGETATQVTEAVGAAVVNDSIELTVDLAGIGLTTQEGRMRVLNALEHIKNHIVTDTWPPA